MAEAGGRDLKPLEARLGLMAWMGIGRDRFGKGFLSQVFEIARLSRPPNRIAPHDYFLYQLFDDHRYSAEAKATFVGANYRTWLRAELLEDPWYLVGDDKPVLESLLRSYGLPVPETRAVYHPVRETGPIRALRTPAELAGWLRTEATYPLFAKPSGWSNGIGAVAIARREGDELVLQDGRKVAVDRFVEAQQPWSVKGTVLQEHLRAHPDVAALVGEDRLATVRVLVLVAPGQAPVIHRAGIRIPTGSNVTDNLWRPGNLLAGVDPATGVLRKAVQGEAGTYDRIHTHPDTGAAFTDTRLPDWDRVRALALQAAAILPRCPIQAWDFALTPDGPKILELEADGAEPGMFQLGQDVGLLEGAFVAVIDAVQQLRASQRGQAAQARREMTAQAYQDVFSNRE